MIYLISYTGVQLYIDYNMRKNDSYNMAKIMENDSIASNRQRSKSPLKMGLAPWVGNNPYVLVLGTLPGDNSIESGIYYSNSQNRFWEIMHSLFGGNPNDMSKDFITSHHIALWDCFKSAERVGSKDKNIVRGTETPNDLISFLQDYPTIKTIIINGTSKGTSKQAKKGFSTLQAFKLYFGELYDNSNYTIVPLYQTSQSNEQYGRITLEKKLKAWKFVKEIIDEQTKVHKD